MTPQRRTFLQALGAVAQVPSVLSSQAQAESSHMPARLTEPRVLIFDDGRHAGIYEFEPPVEPADLYVTVDQLVNSGVDTLLYSAGLEGGVVQYDSRVAQKWGDNVPKWTHPVFYRASRVIHQLIADGYDPMMLLCNRADEKGLWFVPGSWVCVQGGDRAVHGGIGRKSDFAYDHAQFQVGADPDPRAQGLPPQRFNFLHAEVRRERFRIFEELLARYPTDGIELNLAEFAPFCKFGQADELAPVMTQWIGELRAVAQQAQQAQGRKKRIFARIPADPRAWKVAGYDIPAWVSKRLVDGLICLTADVAAQVDQDLELSRAVELTRGTECLVYTGCGTGLGGEHEAEATRQMIWAAAANGYHQGADGFAVMNPANWAPHIWPWRDDEYQTLRLLGHPDMLAVADKIYRVRSVVAGNPREVTPLPGSARPLPRVLAEGESTEIPLRISDDLTYWQARGRIESVRLRVRLTNMDPILNKVQIMLNGQPLPASLLQPWDLTYRLIFKFAAARRPKGFVYEYRLPPDYFPKQGRNTVKVTLLRRDPMMNAPFEVYDLDCSIKYRVHRDFEREPIHY